jgi:O-antigen/teichoic acid export membrane protein
MLSFAENNRMIAKNTLFLYFRLMLTVGVGLYTSRVVLEMLGVEDFGIYNIVGGVIAIFGFINRAMSGATSRFLTFELGKMNHEKLKKTFSAALTVHFIIAGIVFVLGETVGLWFMENKLVIAPERINIARWIYQLSIASTMISITQVPYNATIIAHEKMHVYAYIEILNVLLKLGIVYLLVIGNFDKLILYAVLTLCVTIFITSIYKIYCVKNFSESKYKFHPDKEIIKPMLSFSGWNFISNFSFTMKTHGVNILLNIFFGVILNAAYGIANQFQYVLMGFATNFFTAVRPQIVKYYADEQIIKMRNLVIYASKFSFLLMLLITVPFIMEAHFILGVWLNTVPDYAVDFVKLNLLYSLIWVLMVPFNYAIQATGNIKISSSLTGGIYLSVLPLTYILFRCNYSYPLIPFIINLLLIIVIFIVNIRILSLQIKEYSFFNILIEIVCKGFITFVAVYSITNYCVKYLFDEGWLRFILVVTSNIFTVLICGYFIFLQQNERNKIRDLIISKTKIIFNKKNLR